MERAQAPQTVSEASKDSKAEPHPPQQHAGADAAAAQLHQQLEPGAPPGHGAVVRCFSEVTPSDGRLDFQIIDLGRQVYVWVAAGGAKMKNLCFSIQAPAGGGAPATAVLLRGHAGASGEGLAQRLGEQGLACIREGGVLGQWGALTSEAGVACCSSCGPRGAAAAGDGEQQLRATGSSSCGRRGAATVSGCWAPSCFCARRALRPVWRLLSCLSACN
jgi:hypothetical protein